MAYLTGWLIYLAMAGLLMAGFERYLAPYIGHRELRIFCRCVVAIGLFTPGLAYGDGHFYLVPACIDMLFNLLAHSREGMLKAMLPLLLVSALVFAGLFLYEAKGDEPEPVHEEPTL